MDFALHQPWADAQRYNLSPLRGWLFSAAVPIFTRYANARSCTTSAAKQTFIDVLRNFKMRKREIHAVPRLRVGLPKVPRLKKCFALPSTSLRFPKRLRSDSAFSGRPTSFALFWLRLRGIAAARTDRLLS